MLKTISLKNIGYSYGEKNILKDVSFKFTVQEKICIVGENGAGKSTLLKMIAGINEIEIGNMEKNAHLRCHYISQEFGEADMPLTIGEFISKYAGPAYLNKIFSYGRTLGFDLEKNGEKKCSLLSGGQQKILTLSVGLSLQPDFLLLDEPENHLDIVSRLELIGLLQAFRGGILFVSHDRILIDSLADKVAEVSKGTVFISEGGYEDYLENRLSRISRAQQEYDAEEKKIKKLHEAVRIMGQKAFRGKETAAYHGRKEELEALKEKHKENERPEDKKTKIKIRQNLEGLHKGKLLCRITDASFKYKGNKGDTFHEVNLDIRTGSHIVLLGRNGSGKSTFLKCLIGELPLTSGTVAWTDGVKKTYFDQHTVFDGNLTALQIVMDELNFDEMKARAALGAMKFDSDKMDTQVQFLSGGERMRLRFALVFGPTPDFIILDEPTNHLDETTWEILLNSCNRTKSTILLVTHDYEFIEELESKTPWVIKGNEVNERHKSLPELVDELRGE